MLQKDITSKILDFVRQKPRTIQEIAFLIKKNWRTADRYVDIISTETGFISLRTFRQGTRGALKVVFWNALEGAKGSAYQELLLQKIIQGKQKEDFSPFDIYQFVAEDKREAFLEDKELSSNPKINLPKVLLQAKHQVLCFSGNLSWTELGPEVVKALEALSKNKIPIKVLTRVDIISKKNTELALNLNKRFGWDVFSIRHCQHPLRALIIDDQFFNIKEVLSPVYHRELKTKMFIFYTIKDPEWINWLQKLFWHLWNQSIDAQIRLKALDSVRRLVK